MKETVYLISGVAGNFGSSTPSGLLAKESIWVDLASVKNLYEIKIRHIKSRYH